MREFKIVTQGNLYKITFAKGGEVADVLKGSFTSSKAAQAAIDKYMKPKLPFQRKNKAKPNTYAHKRIGEIHAENNARAQ